MSNFTFGGTGLDIMLIRLSNLSRLAQKLKFVLELCNIITKFAKNLMTKIPYIRIKTNWKSEKLTNFNPVAELPQDKSKALMSKPTGAGMPVYVYSERFPSRLKIGAACQAMDIEHRFVKVYDIEFHFGMNEGVIISDKIRKRTDPERGVKINFIGWTKESQWEVQKIYDQFNDFYLEDGVFKEGKFSITKYHLSANNCIHFSNAFVEALLKNNDQIKKKPPSVLKQPLINGNSCQFVANCFMPPTTSDSDD
uniref:PPPDE domain-containing protein n=1 Tax=Globodera rostochiensis TaxID=31243 RepID=A0A914HM20_GLORO